MSQQINSRKVFNLSEVTDSIRRTLAGRYGSRFWVKAEMNKLNRYEYSGHCYPDFIERAESRIVAQMRGIIWANDFRRINAAFLQATGEQLSDGMQLMLEASVSFDPNHGLSLVISDIDPSFTLGELELEKRRCIMRLKHEGIWDSNRSLPTPFLPKRLAIISVTTSKGYADFISLINARSQGFLIEHMLFPAILQGEKAVEQITAQLNNIRKASHHFDLVAIIRGGGGDTGLSAFNHYTLASAVASFPLPVLTGIGHATNLTVTELVAHTRAITPSELADILLEKFEYLKTRIERASSILKSAPLVVASKNAEIDQLILRLSKSSGAAVASNRVRLEHLAQLLTKNIQHQLLTKERQLKSFADILRRISPLLIERSRARLSQLQTRLVLGCGSMLGVNKHRLETFSAAIALQHPEGVLKRGFSITRLNGKALRDASELQTGMIISTELARGSIQSQIIKTEKHENG